MTEVEYRCAQPSDAGALAETARASFLETFGALYRAEDLEDFLRRSYAADIQRREILDQDRETRLAIATSGQVAGFCQIGPHKLPFDPGPGRALELYRLYVLAPWQGAGVANALTDWAIERALARKAHALFLGVWRHNARAQRFYARYGFQKVGEYLFEVGAARDEEDILRLPL